ncbi:MAG TPA: hypothetical protein VG265_05200 [Gaiellaceae bacterium]|nr:hypothetical protein [Gaiellaceae bacterium]
MTRAASALVVAALIFVAVSSGATARPSLRHPASSPRVVGDHFKPHELVAVTFRSGKTKLVRSVHATGAGKFTVDFAALQQVKCTGTISLVAIGAKGDRSAFTITSSPSCGSGSGSVSPAVTTPTSGATTTTTTAGIAPPPPYVT